MATISIYTCPVCGSTDMARNECYCEYHNSGTFRKVNKRVYSTRPTRRVKGLFTITGFHNLGYGTSAMINLEKDGEEFQLYFRPLADKIIGKSEIELTLFEKKSGGWTTSGYNTDYIYDNGKLRLKEDVYGKFFLSSIKYHTRLKNTRYVRYIIKCPNMPGREFEVFAKNFKIEELLDGKFMKLREDATAGSYVWKEVK